MGSVRGLLPGIGRAHGRDERLGYLLTGASLPSWVENINGIKNVLYRSVGTGGQSRSSTEWIQLSKCLSKSRRSRSGVRYVMLPPTEHTRYYRSYFFVAFQDPVTRHTAP